MTVRNLLDRKGRHVTAVKSDASIQDVIDKLEAEEVGALVVTDNGENILGLVSERDVIRAMKKFGEEVFRQPVGDIMRRDVVTCDIDAPMIGAMHLMNKHQIRQVPVVDNGKLCGIVAIHDVVENRLKELQREADALRDYVAGYG